MKQDDLSFQMTIVLAEEVFKLLRGCDNCPAQYSCRNVNNPDLYGTECVATIRSWAQQRVGRDRQMELQEQSKQICLVCNKLKSDCNHVEV